MKKLIEKIKNIDEKKMSVVVFSVFFLQPIFELDIWLYEYISIPRPSVIFHYIFIPIIVLVLFIKYEDKKKKIFSIFLVYFLLIGSYFVLHSINCIKIFDSLYLTNNFYYSIYQEAVYICTLIMPYFIIYAFYKANIDEDLIKKTVMLVSLVISVLIILGDVFMFGLSTYNGTTTKAPFYMWFFGIYGKMHPRDVSSKFFFPEGNTLGIYLFITLVINYYYLLRCKDKKEKIWFIVTILLQSLTMWIIGTKVGTYGTIIIPVVTLIIYFLMMALKKESLRPYFIVTCATMALISSLTFTHTPAYVNTQINNANNTALLKDTSDLLNQAKKEIGGGNLVPGTAEYNYYYIYYFEDWGIKGKLISSIPSEYYTLYYQYKFDGKFWWDVLDLYPLEQRCNGRQMQTIFNNYKWNPTNRYTKLMGMGYSTFMNGSFLIERDFVQQRYTLGYLGDFLTLGPWALMALYGVFKILTNFKEKFNFKTLMFGMAFCLAIASGLTSGHTFDQYLTISVISLVSMVLLKEVNE